MHPSYLLMSLGLLSLIMAIACLQTLVSVIPTLVACIFRAKEAVNLEDSMSLARERNTVFYMLLLPTLIVASWYNLPGYGFLDHMCPELRLAITLGVTVVYAGVRALMAKMLGKGNCSQKLYTAYLHCFRNFAIIAMILGLIVSGILSMCGCEAGTVRTVVYCITGFSYLIYLIHKASVFAMSNSGFTSFLYLCALEILPTGMLVAAAVVF